MTTRRCQRRIAAPIAIGIATRIGIVFDWPPQFHPRNDRDAQVIAPINVKYPGERQPGHLQRQFNEARQSPVGIDSADGRYRIDAIQRLALAGAIANRATLSASGERRIRAFADARMAAATARLSFEHCRNTRCT
ncbi:hypothetical protein [Paraburkholderia sp. EG304]|uniref:hypothetical protein n=1 Tax=Paraburkholderia sp. EG304 TaxID=3237015 RepID=UPI0039795301